MLTAAQVLEQQRAEHPGAEGFMLGDAAIVMRRPTPAEFLALASVAERKQRGHVFLDPAKVHKPVLALLVHGQDEAEAELAECPAFESQLYDLASELAGSEDIAIEDAPELVAENPKAKQLIGLKVCDVPLIVRKIDKFDWQRHNGNVVSMPSVSEAVAQLALDQLMEQPDKTGARPQWDALCARYPALPIELGSELQRRAKSRAERIAGK